MGVGRAFIKFRGVFLPHTTTVSEWEETAGKQTQENGGTGPE